MMTNLDQRLRDIVGAFKVSGEYVSAARWGSGHINDSYLVTLRQSRTDAQYLLQRINDRVFADVPALMENIRRVCDHLHAGLRAQGCRDSSRRALTLVPTRAGQDFHRDDAGYWRLQTFIAGATAYDVVLNEAHAFEAARAFGEFQRLVADLPGGPLKQTIADFHNTAVRYAELERAIETDPRGRATSAAQDISFVRARAGLCNALLDRQRAGLLPARTIHNDTKVNNVLIDNATGKAICVVDLDTLMPGLVPYDFGDLALTASSPVAEDEPDLSRVEFRAGVFAALARGFVEGAHETLWPEEIAAFPLGAKAMTLEQAMRFLTDFLLGDLYFPTRRPRHNLDRCRTQLKLLACMEEQENAMARCTMQAMRDK